MRKRYIYKIVSPTDRIYIGQTVNITQRRSMYNTLRCKDQPKLYKSLVKYGFNNHKFDVIIYGDFDKETIDSLEIEYIKVYKSFSEKGLNLCEGGSSNSGYIHTEETKRNMSINRKGKPAHNKGSHHTEISKEKLSFTLKELYKDKTKHGRYNKSLSQETKNKIADSLKGKKQSQETILKRIETRKRNLQLNLRD